MSDDSSQSALLAPYVERRRAWHFLFNLWFCIYYGLGITSVVCSIASTKFQAKTALAVIAAACTALLILLKAHSTAKAYTRAWHLLDVACKEFELDPNADPHLLLEALKKGEDILDRDAD